MQIDEIVFGVAHRILRKCSIVILTSDKEGIITKIS